MLRVTPDIAIGEHEIRYDFVRSSGPGGQNVNKVSSAVQLRFNVNDSASLPLEVKTRLRKLAGKKISTDGILIIQASRFKSQEKNRQDAIERLIHLIRQATVKPKKRVKTNPSRRAKLRRLESKRHRSRLKDSRRSVHKDAH
ncbi:MAG: aminoacyl-tRNA hydrolase [Desulfobacterales bacterium]|nr:aminoacyl-tRNA hydrolase [Desulfobacterales bacterium]